MCDVTGVKSRASSDEAFMGSVHELQQMKWMRYLHVARVYSVNYPYNMGDIENGTFALFGSVVEGHCTKMHDQATAKNGQEPFRLLNQLVIRPDLRAVRLSRLAIPLLGEQLVHYSALVPRNQVTGSLGFLKVMFGKVYECDAIATENGGHMFGNSARYVHLVLKGFVSHRTVLAKLQEVEDVGIIKHCVAFVKD